MTQTLHPFDLTQKYKDSGIEKEFENFKKSVKNFSDVNEVFGLKTGDVIKFVGGHDPDMEFTSRILGFDSDGYAFVLWDCYWFPVNLERRLIQTKSN